MTQRERQPSGGVTEAAPPLEYGHETLPRPGTVRDAEIAGAPIWEEIFRNSSPTQQQELLALARRQGLLYAHQLPHATNGNATHETGRQALIHLLQGQPVNLEPVRPLPVDCVDSLLDPMQREAVARAMRTPDVCLISGLPGTGKSRVAAEIVLQAARNGERILLLAPTSAAIDLVLEQVGSSELLCPVRCLSRNERPETLPPALRGFTYAERLRALRELPLLRARQNLAAAREACQRQPGCDEVFRHLGEITAHWTELERRLAAVRHDDAQLADAVAREALSAEKDALDHGGFGAELVRLAANRGTTLARLDAARTELIAKHDQQRQLHGALELQVQERRRILDSKRLGHWWSADYWRATFSGTLQVELEKLEADSRQMQTELDLGAGQLEKLEAERHQAETEYAEQRRTFLDGEIAVRRAAITTQETALGQEQENLRDRWRQSCQTLPPAAVSLAEPGAAFEAARTAWKERCTAEQQQQDLAVRWVEYLEQEAEAMPARLVEYTNLVAATISSFAADEHFGDRAASGILFDLAIVQEADHVSRADWLTLARRARRCVLIGEPAEQPAPGQERGSTEAGRAPAFFATLWQALVCEPRWLPYSWRFEKDRLVCALRSVPAEQRQRLERERVVDRPDIELRILALPNAAPALTEIVFPPNMPATQAKEFIFKELEELAVSTTGSTPRWSEDSERLVLHFESDSGLDGGSADLGEGVREVLARRPAVQNGAAHAPCSTAALEFDRRAGWDRLKAEDWVKRHLGLSELGRAVRLDVPHRMHDELALFLSDLLFAGDYRLPRGLTHPPKPSDGTARPGAAAVEFVAVTSPRTAPEQNGRNARRQPPPKQPRPASMPREGSGLEIDLAERRNLQRLPTELHAGLPERGIVNYLEAQALVRHLEALAAEPAGGNGNSRPTAAVVALYPAQADLIRQLVRNSPVLSRSTLTIDIDTPAAFRQRERSYVLVSLTRSHLHRAVPFGESPQMLALAFTRARSRLILFGDPGTLIRRSQWTGPLDHLDQAGSARERDIIAGLVRYLDGQAAHQSVFQLRPGGDT